MKVHIETDRLMIRDLELSDAEGMYALDSDPAVHQFLGNKPIQSMQEAIEVIKYIRKQYESNGIGRWAIIDKDTQDFIGWTGLKYEDGLRSEFNYYDLGYRLRKKFWGKGIATESALASLQYGFEKMKLKEIGAAAHVDHLISNKILTKLGLKFVDTFEYEGAPHNWFNIERSQWEESKI